MYKRQRVLLIGNGLNREYGGIDWSSGIKAININPKLDISSSEFDRVPYPLKAILASGDNIEIALKEPRADDLKFGVKDMGEISVPIRQLCSIQFDHVLTTNYSYEIERALDPRFTRKGEHQKQQVREFNHNTILGKQPENKYLLHTYNEVWFNGILNRVWHIHGEGRKPDSIALGHYFYGNLLGQYQKALKERTQRMNDLTNYDTDEESRDSRSWVDEFMDSDVYIVGLGMDYSEFDLWWLLNEKKNEGSGKVVFYGPAVDAAKRSLLGAMEVETRELGFYTKPPRYRDFYCEVIKDISIDVIKQERGELVHV